MQDIDIKPDQRKIMLDLLNDYPPGVTVWAYGLGLRFAHQRNRPPAIRFGFGGFCIRGAEAFGAQGTTTSDRELSDPDAIPVAFTRGLPRLLHRASFHGGDRILCLRNNHARVTFDRVPKACKPQRAHRWVRRV